MAKRKSDEKQESALKMSEKAVKKKSLVCFICRQEGHMKKDCKVKSKKDDNSDNDSRRKTAKVKVASGEEMGFAFGLSDSSSEWTIDSGSSCTTFVLIGSF